MSLLIRNVTKSIKNCNKFFEDNVLQRNKLSTWVQISATFTKQAGDNFVYLETPGSTVDFSIDHVYVGSANDFNACKKLQIQIGEGKQK